MSHLFKYQADLNSFCKTCSCPEEDYFDFDHKECFRFVFEDLAHPNNFTPVAKIAPARALNESCESICRLYGLSLFGSKDGARERFNELTQTSSKRFKTNIGTHIAKGVITRINGQITSEERLTHFELYEYDNTNISESFAIIEML